jgi:hypothetical protein
MVDTAAERRAKYDPQKRHDYYMKTRVLKGKSPSGTPTSAQTMDKFRAGERAVETKRHEQALKDGKTSKRLEDLQRKQVELDNAEKELIVALIQGRVVGDPAKYKQQIDDARAKIRAEMWIETKRLQAKKSVSGVVNDPVGSAGKLATSTVKSEIGNAKKVTDFLRGK